MKYNICVPIPVKFAIISEVKPIIDKVIKSKSNLIEFRFDYIDDVQNLSVNFIKNLLNTIDPNIPVIFTFRDSSEGGKIKIKQKERFKIIKMFIETKPAYIDIEMNIDKSFLSEVINLAYQNEVKMIFSYHNFERTLSFDNGINLIQNFKEKLIKELSLDPKILEENFYKIIFTAQTFEDNLIPLKICKEISNKNQNIIAFCMGTLGIFSRIMCVFAGSFLTYASLEDKTAPGQIHIKKIREIYKLILNNY